MTLRRKFGLYLGAVHLLFLVLTLYLCRSQPLLMFSLEALLLLSLAAGLLLVAKLGQPLDYARRFGELLQDRSYAARLQAAPGDEISALVDQFNHMLDALYQERLKLGEQRGFLDRLLQATPSAVVVFDFDGRISMLNASALGLLGLANPEERKLSDWLEGRAEFVAGLDEAGRRRALSMVEQLAVLPTGESRMLSDPDGRRFRAQRGQFFDRGFAREFLLIEELTSELESSERSTYERLVRVLAHEVNNTVAATGSVLESLLYYRAQLESSDGQDFATAIDAVSRRNRSLGEFIERFTRVIKMPAPQTHRTDLGELLESIARLYREPCRSRGIAIEWTVRDPVGPQLLDANLMEQALMNVVKNALEAVETSLQEQQLQEGYVHLELAREPGRIRLSIVDSGNRLPDVPGGQMFSPFFTTKKGGQGIGLLLVREVLNRHGIAFRLAASGLGETRFDMWLDSPE